MRVAERVAETAGSDDTLPSRWVHIFAGLCCLCVGLAFSYLDRSFGDFRAAAPLWAIVTAIGFGAGAINLHRGGAMGRVVCIALGVVLLLPAIYPALGMYSLLRWMTLCLMFVVIARAAVMRTRKDLYLSLAVCFVSSCVTAIHLRVDWTVWVYLGPAWVFAGLALTVEYVATRDVSGWIKGWASIGFIGACASVALVLFLFLPRPALLGFGFLPPGTDAPGLVETQASGATPGGAAGAAAGSSLSAAGRPSASGSWSRMIEGMRPALADPHMPAWQRQLLQRLLDLSSAVARYAHFEPAEASGDGSGEAESTLISLFRLPSPWCYAALVLAAVALYWCWLRRHTLALRLLSLPAWALQHVNPAWSMKLSAYMFAYALACAGHGSMGNRTLREQLASARGLPKLARRWFGEALEVYYAARFGRTTPTAAQAGSMRLAVLNAADLSIDNERHATPVAGAGA